MKFNIPFISISMLFCLTAQIFAPTVLHPLKDAESTPWETHQEILIFM